MPTDPRSDAVAPDPRRTKRRWVRWSFEACAVLCVYGVLRAWQQPEVVSSRAPSLRVTDLSGRAVELGAGAGEPRLLWFYARWCGVCRASAHNARALAGEPGVVLVATDSGSDEDVRSDLRARGLAGARVVNDHDGAIARRFGVRAFPTTFAVGADGTIRATDVGYTTELGLRARLAWARR
jgi:hypothetical protein